MVLLLGGVFMVMLFIPGMAETDAISRDRYPAIVGGSGVSITGTQSPVLNGGAFTNYDTVFFAWINGRGQYGIIRCLL